MSRRRANSRTVTRTPILIAFSRASASSGSAVAPSIHTSPPSKYSCFQIGTICLIALDRVAARGKRIGAVRRRRGDRDAGLADLQPADAVVDRRGGPPATSRATSATISSSPRSASGS